ncbi:MAG: threonine--tRNA ligase [Deltaproteobacteria bacterium]|nr:MAG: threonine--tRNA ligase [Deltaproteobacteria bacterium]
MEKKVTISVKGSPPVEIRAQGLNGLKALRALSMDNMERMAAIKINGEIKDLSAEINSSAELEPVYIDSQEGLQILRHSAAHVMAEAVRELFPGTKVTIGPAIKNGFYYDFDYERAFEANDLPKIEKRMAEIIEEDLPFIRNEIPHSEAIDFFRSEGEPYKVELIEELSEEAITMYRQGNFTDLCRGPHLPSTGKIRAFQLTHVAGAYWRGDERNAMLSRIYGVAFADRESLNAHLKNLEEARKRDHRVLGRKLDLFTIRDDVGPGMVIFHPNGAMLRRIIEEFEIKEHLKRGYELATGPQLLKTELWKKSGHFDHYREHMYFTSIEDQSYGVKPMNCLAHMLIYSSKVRSYRELPKRYFELGTVHRHERSGVLHGLIRVRQFTQDDAHILCTPEQLKVEIQNILDFVRDIMAIFGFDYDLEISTRPKKSIGTDVDWQKATKALIDSVEEYNLPYQINQGEGAFYGPKIDVMLKDALERSWQCATIQCDFALPERFDLTYVGPDGEKHRPAMIHRVILGSIERFLGVLIEHYAGAFPLWLAPVQAIIFTITDRNIPYGEDLLETLSGAGIRAGKDFRNEKLSFKVREAQMKKIPYMLVVGDKEMETGNVTTRLRDGRNLPPMSPKEVVDRIRDESKNRR